VLAASFGIYQSVHPKLPPPATSISFQLKTDPEGAAVNVDDSNKGTAPLPLSLPPGRHEFKLSLPGYKPIERNLDIAQGFSPSGPEHLEALPADLQITSDLPDLKLTLDGGTERPPAPGVPFALPDLTLDTEHTLHLAAGTNSADISFAAAAAHVPDLQLKASGTAASVFVLSAFGGKGRFYASSKIKLSVDGGQSYRDAGPEGLDLDTIPADGVLTIQDDKGLTRPVPTNAPQSPMVQVFFFGAKAPANVGSLSIQTNESDFVVLVDGKKVFYQRKGPPYAVYNITAGARQVQIQREGFRSDPPSVKVEVKPNQVASVAVNLVAAPTQLVVQGAVAGTRVSVGPRQLGVTDPRGDLRTEMQPGSYTVTLSKDGYRSRNLNVTVSNGQAGRMASPQSRLDLITGTIILKKEPSRMRLSIKQLKGVPMENPANYEEAPEQLILPIGQYILIFEAAGYNSDTVGPIGLAEGQSLLLPVKLAVGLDRIVENAEGSQFCQQAANVFQRFPFYQRSNTDAAVPDFIAVFQPGMGSLAMFFQSSLQDLLVPGPPVARKAGARINVRQDYLNFFNQASAISRAFFPGNSPRPSLAYSVQALPSNDVENFTLLIGGRAIRNFGERQDFVWNGDSVAVSLSVKPRSGQAPPALIAGGPWGLFHLLVQADRVSPGAAIYEYDLRASSSFGRQTTNTGNTAVLRLQVDAKGFPGLFAGVGTGCVARVAE
jgi:hypothetical protein